MIGSSRRFWGLFQKLLVETQAIANISSVAFLAALAIENDCLESIRSQSKISRTPTSVVLERQRFLLLSRSAVAGPLEKLKSPLGVDCFVIAADSTPDVSLPSAATSCNSRSDARQGRARSTTGACWLRYLFGISEAAPVLCRGGAPCGLRRSALQFALPAILAAMAIRKRENRRENGMVCACFYLAKFASASPAQDRGSQQRDV